MQLSSRLFISIYKTISTKFDIFKYGKCTKRMQDEVSHINTKIMFFVRNVLSNRTKMLDRICLRASQYWNLNRTLVLVSIWTIANRNYKLHMTVSQCEFLSTRETRWISSTLCFSYSNQGCGNFKDVKNTKWDRTC